MWRAVNGRQDGVASDGIIYYMNGQAIDALAFRVVSCRPPPSKAQFMTLTHAPSKSLVTLPLEHAMDVCYLRTFRFNPGSVGPCGDTNITYTSDCSSNAHKAPSCLSQDVTSRADGRLIGRAFVSAATLTTLQGSISATIMSPQLEMVRHRQ